ncbi:hypothetical protein EVAR_10125_1 [Eumeta japonica]|uniref:Uncharacterized protein n=1 Tax=Eumeta variegata TaxID=151549 RepID=A0A4C1UDM3_EUMVA|nr:hypothetical protein EVAR_10125_1 [Eumeta japonica]
MKIPKNLSKTLCLTCTQVKEDSLIAQELDESPSPAAVALYHTHATVSSRSRCSQHARHTINGRGRSESLKFVRLVIPTCSTLTTSRSFKLTPSLLATLSIRFDVADGKLHAKRKRWTANLRHDRGEHVFEWNEILPSLTERETCSRGRRFPNNKLITSLIYVFPRLFKFDRYKSCPL